MVVRDGDVSTNPNPAHTFLNDGIYDATVRVTSGDQVALCTRTITVARVLESPSPTPTPTPTPGLFRLHVVRVGSGAGTVTGPGINCPTDCEEFFLPGTVVTLTANGSTSPPTVFLDWTGHCSGSGPCVLTMDTNRNVVAHFERAWTLTFRGGFASDVNGDVTSSPPGIACTWPPGCVSTTAFLNGTTVTLTVLTSGLTLQWGGACAGVTGPVCAVPMDADKLVTLDTLRNLHGGIRSSAKAPALVSQLEVPGGEARVILNGRVVSSVRVGPMPLATERSAGTNHVEGVIVRGSGRPGGWRFDLSGHRSFRPGSLRALAGAVALLAGDSVVFALQGKPGERIAFTFEADD